MPATPKLLIVEDDNLMIQAYRDRLAAADWISLAEVVFVKTPTQARRHITDGCKVVILDHRLIGGTGLDVVQWAEGIYDEVHFIRCSTEREGDYPTSIPWFNKINELSKALTAARSWLLHGPPSVEHAGYLAPPPHWR